MDHVYGRKDKSFRPLFMPGEFFFAYFVFAAGLRSLEYSPCNVYLTCMNMNNSAQQRLPWQDYFMHIAYLVRSRSTCLRRMVGCVLVKNKRILATGYNGAPANVPHCLETGCLREKLGVPSGERHELCRALHAEQNVIIQAAVSGVSIAGAEIYCTTHPCILCSKMLINCGVTTIYYCESYPDKMSQEMLDQAGVRLVKMEIPKPLAILPDSAQ